MTPDEYRRVRLEAGLSQSELARIEMSPIERDSFARAAAKRWGQASPSFDDVLMEACPRYNELESDTRLWHDLKDRALDFLDMGESR